jgi:hypothetical protein
MAYVVNKTNGNIVAVVEDGTIDTISTSVKLVGKGTTNYGEYVAENSIVMLEHFANDSAPPNPITGQLWYNSDDGFMYVFNGTSWIEPTPQTFYSTIADTTGTGSITISNDAGITVGDGPTVQLAVIAGNAVLKTSITDNGGITAIEALKVNPADGQVTMYADPTADLGVATKQYVDNLESIGVGEEDRLTVTTDSITLVLGNETMISGDNNGVTLLGIPRATNIPNVLANDDQIANTAFVQNNKVSPAFTGVPTAPTAITVTNTTQIATTAFVQNNKVSPAFSGTPTTPTATTGTNTTQIASTAFVQNQLAADKISPAFSGVPTTPTAALNTNTTQVASTAFVRQEIADIDLTPYATILNPTFTGIPRAPTAAEGNSSTQIASTSYVMTATERWGGSRKFVSSSEPTSGQGSDGDFWFKLV